ncbi:MAG: DUF4003 family protein [Lachnospiraceae bacterium]|nr:DUF4003 family protein [Lachnospiraceae bacterium]
MQNRDTIKETIGWKSAYMYPVCAAIFTDRKQLAEESKLKECRDILKANTGIFSNFRSTAQLVMLSMMAVEADAEGKLKHSLEAYQIMKKHFFTSEYLPVVAMILTNFVEPSQYENKTVRTREIYDLMKKEHPFLTSSEDSVFATLLSLSEQTNEQLIHEIERCYQLLKPHFFSGNAVQSLSQVLALQDGTAEEKCEKTMKLFHALEARKHKYGTDYELSTLGVLALLHSDMEQIEQDIIDVDDFLSKQKGYGILGIGKKQRLMHAGMIVMSSYMDDESVLRSAAINGTISLIIAQQAAMCAAIAASSAAAGSASSGGN